MVGSVDRVGTVEELDEAERGFSFMHDGPLDMRMSNAGFSAADFIESASEEEIANVIYK